MRSQDGVRIHTVAEAGRLGRAVRQSRHICSTTVRELLTHCFS